MTAHATTARTIRPTGRGFLLLDSHPTGCSQLVRGLWAQAAPPAAGRGDGSRPVAVVIGSSAGYGLAATIAGIARYGIDGVGLCYEKAPTQRRTATAGWYRTAATAQLAAAAGRRVEFVNTDCFTDAAKHQVGDLIAQQFAGVDYLIYSVAAPRRTDPATGRAYQSALKPIGSAHRTKTLEFDDGVPRLREIEIPAATDDEIEATVKVMGGEDWARWVDALEARGLLLPGFTTVALSYIGSALTSAIYRQGSIGAAKGHLEATAVALDARLSAGHGGRAVTSVNAAAVTQASTAIPAIALYLSLLRAAMGERMPTPMRQLTDLWDQLTGTLKMDTDERGRIRLDRQELADDVQAAVAERWAAATPANIADLADTDWFRDEVHRLYGFAVPGVDYDQPVPTDIPWPTPTAARRP